MILGVTLSEVIQHLKSEGFDNAAQHRIHHAITRGYITRPHKNLSGRYVFTEINIGELKAYLYDVPAAGRKKAEYFSS